MLEKVRMSNTWVKIGSKHRMYRLLWQKCIECIESSIQGIFATGCNEKCQFADLHPKCPK